MRIHTYVIVRDAGSAPNYDPPVVTLAVCKPRIRKKARVGDLVLAFSGRTLNRHEPHAVVWAGIASEKLTFSEYWRDPRFQRKKPSGTTRPDNFYMPYDGGLLQIENPVHRPEETRRDTSGEYVLVFSPSWRFGANGPVLPFEFGLRMTGVRRGERIWEKCPRDSERLLEWLGGEQVANPFLIGSDYGRRQKQCWQP